MRDVKGFCWKRLGLMFALLIGSAVVGSAQDIRQVDLKNFTYRLSCGTADRVSAVTVRGGEYRGDKRGLEVYLNIYEIVYGDINGDGRDEAVVLYMCGSGASYAYFRGLIFTGRNNKASYLTSLTGGNKGDGGFHEVRVEKGLLVVERNQVGVGGSACCPATIETTKYRLKGTRLVPVGKTKSRKI